MLTGTAVLVAPHLPAGPPAATAAVLRLDPEPRASRSYRPTPAPTRDGDSERRRRGRETPAPSPASFSKAPSPTHVALAAVRLNPARETVIEAALAQVGDPYVWAAAGPDAFDCSGLVLYAFARAGYVMPHYSGSQHALGNVAPVSSLDRGDLVGWAGHVAIYLGGGRIVEASGTAVRVRTLDPRSWWDASAFGVSLDYSQLPR